MAKVLRFLLWTALVIGVLIGVARATAIRWWRVPEDDPTLTASVTPSIAAGDLLLLWRLTEPERGDLVMCPEPDAPERVVIGRIIAEEEDTVLIEGHRLKVNKKWASTERSCLEPTFEVEDPNTGEPVEQRCQIETLRGHAHQRGEIPPGSSAPATHATEVPNGNVFLISDNRLYPYDSRDFGTVERNTCKESIFFRVVGKGGYSDAKTRFTYIH